MKKSLIILFFLPVFAKADYINPFFPGVYKPMRTTIVDARFQGFVFAPDSTEHATASKPIVFTSLKISDSLSWNYGIRFIRGKEVWMYWSNFTICTGSGSCTLNGNGAHSPGDVGQIVTGNYTTGSFTNLNGLTITYQSSRTSVIFSSTVTYGSNTNTTMTGFDISGPSGVSLSLTGHNEGGTISNIAFFNGAGNAMDCNTGTNFNGTTASMPLYNMTFDSLYLNHVSYLLFIGFGQINNNQNFTDRVTFSRIRIIQTRTNGEEIRGVAFNLTCTDWFGSYTGTNPSGGDVGFLTIFGNANMDRIYQYGWSGYICRIYNAALVIDPGNSSVTRSLKAAGLRYGFIDMRTDGANIVGGVSQENGFTAYNCTEWGCIDDGGYITTFIVMGQVSTSFHFIFKNIVVVNSTSDASNTHMIHNNSAGTWQTGDSSNNVYYGSAAGIIDTTGTFPTFKPVSGSPIIGTGVNVGLSDDYFRIVFSNPPPKGYAMFAAVPPPAGCTAPDCQPNRRFSKKVN